MEEEQPIEKAQWDKRQRELQASFLQSALWGDFQAAIGHLPHYISGDDWCCLLIERHTPLGRYLFAPYGPTLTSEKQLSPAVKDIKDYAKKLGFDWVIIEPMLPGGSHRLQQRLSDLGTKKSSHLREPDYSRIINLTPAVEELLSGISQSTRSLIRKNQKEKFLTFETSRNPEDIKIFIQMLQSVTKRKNIHFFPDDYFRKQAKILMPAGMLHMVLALKDGKPIASALFHTFGDRAFYTYAASLPEARQTSASALLLWQAIQNAKQQDIAKMDLFGIAPDDAKASHPWFGFSSFKKKFGGEVVAYAGAWDIPISNRYRLYRQAQNIRRMIRRH